MIPKSAGDQQRNRVGEEEGGVHPDEGVVVNSEGILNIRSRYRDDRLVEQVHEEPDTQGDHREPGLPLGQVTGLGIGGGHAGYRTPTAERHGHGPGKLAADLLESGADAVQAVIAVTRSHDLQSCRQSGIGRKARRDGHAAHASEVERQGAQVKHVHRQRVVVLLAELERSGRRRRGDQDVDLLKCLVEILLDEGTYALCLDVVRVVVANLQCVGTNDDASLYLVAEAGSTGCGHDLVGRVLSVVVFAHAVTHAVETSEV